MGGNCSTACIGNFSSASNTITLEMMLKIKLPSGKIIKIENLNVQDSILDIKKRYQIQECVSITNIWLFFKDQILLDSLRIDNYDFQDGDELEIKGTELSVQNNNLPKIE